MSGRFSGGCFLIGRPPLPVLSSRAIVWEVVLDFLPGADAYVGRLPLPHWPGAVPVETQVIIR